MRDLYWAFPRARREGTTPGRLAVELQVPLGANGAVSRRVAVELGAIDVNERGCRLPVAISASPRFPTFTGFLQARETDGETELVLAGDYRLPLGIAGRVSGVLGGDALAHASLEKFFQTVVETLEHDLQAMAPDWRPAPVPESLRDA